MSKTLNDAWQHYATVKDQSHGTAHIQSVLNNAMELAKHYPNVNKRDVEYAAVLHDIGHQAQTGAAGYHPIIGVGIASKYLDDLPEASRTAILDAVRHHHGEETPKTDVGRIIRDADRLASTETPATLANRAFLYRVAKRPNQDVNATARSAYKYLRTKKLNRLQTRSNNAFLTAEGRQMFDNNVKNINDATSSYEKFTKLLDKKGVNPMYTRNDKVAGILDYIATVQKDDNKTSIKVRHDNNMFQDAYQAFKGRNLDDEYSKERMKILGGTAAAALGAGLMIYNRGKLGEIITKANKNPVRTPFMNQVARRVGPVLTLGGLYGAYAHKDDEDKTARNIALGVAGLGMVGTRTIGARSVETVITPEERAAILKKVPIALVSSNLLSAGLIHSTNAAQKIDDAHKVDELLHSKEPIEEVARRVNSIREKKNIASRYPLTRIFNTVPILGNAAHYSIGTPSGKLSPEDMALYIKYQKEN